MNATAYAVGHHVALGPRYSFETTTGRRVLAHELAHVIQQGRGGESTPAPLTDSELERCANRAAVAVTKESAPIHVIGASALGLARQPRSLRESFNPSALSDEELEQEISLISEWLRNNPYSSVERNRLAGVLHPLMMRASRRIVGLERRIGRKFFPFLPQSLKANVQLANLAVGFTSGFLQGPRLSLPAESPSYLSTLGAELKKPKNSLLFHLGI